MASNAHPRSRSRTRGPRIWTRAIRHCSARPPPSPLYQCRVPSLAFDACSSLTVLSAFALEGGRFTTSTSEHGLSITIEFYCFCFVFLHFFSSTLPCYTVKISNHKYATMKLYDVHDETNRYTYNSPTNPPPCHNTTYGTSRHHLRISTCVDTSEREKEKRRGVVPVPSLNAYGGICFRRFLLCFLIPYFGGVSFHIASVFVFRPVTTACCCWGVKSLCLSFQHLSNDQAKQMALDWAARECLFYQSTSQPVSQRGHRDREVVLEHDEFWKDGSGGSGTWGRLIYI
jgi:hypothetical protein